MRVGVVGAGSMGHAHMEGWARTGARLIGVVSNDVQAAAELAARYDARAYRHFEELLAEVDVVDLCVPTDLHKDMTVQAAAAGKHVVCEKPIALTLEDGRTMIAACERAGVRLFVAMVVRFFPQYRAAQQAVRAGRVGDLGVLRLKRVSYRPLRKVDDWYADEARSGGMLLDLMVHDFDYARWLAGRVTRVFARSARSGQPGASGDYALVTLRFAGGAMALIEGGWVYPPGTFRTGLDLAGSTGLIEWHSDDTEPIHRYLIPTTSEGVSEVGLPLSVLAEDPYTTQLKHVYRALAHDEPFDVTAEDALAALQVALAAKQSLQTGRSVTLEGGV